MILSYEEMTSDSPFGRNVFGTGKLLDSPEQSWTSTLPNDMEALAGSVMSDPALALVGATSKDLAKIQADVLEGKISKGHLKYFARAIADTALYNVVNASRQMIGMTVQTVGISSNSFGIVRNLFRQEAAVALRIVDMAKAFVDSDLFDKALDALGLIPVIGWIIKIVIEVAQSIAKMVTVILDDRLKTARSVAAQQLSIPMSATNFAKDADDSLVRMIYKRMREGAQQTFIEPAYLGKFSAQGVYDDGRWADDRNKEMGLGWVVQPGAIFGGMGFVPGTGNLARSLFFPAGVTSAPSSDSRGCRAGAVRDLGSLYPTGSALLNAWWSMVLKPGPSMFSVNAKEPIKHWENSIYDMLVLGPNVLQGWTCAPTGIPFSNKFWCVDGLMGKKSKSKSGMDGCKRSKRGSKLTIPGEFGQGAHVTLVSYLYRLYFGLEKLSNRTKNFNPDLGIGIPTAGKKSYYRDSRGGEWLDPNSIDISESAPVRALENLYERQMATLKSINCMYVDGEKENRHKFPAFNSRRLRDQWYESVTAIMSGSDWRQVVLDDVPESRMKSELIGLIRKKGLNPDDFNSPCPPGAPMSHPCRKMRLRAAPTVLGSPKLPDPPGANRVTPLTGIPATTPKRKKKKAPSGTIVAAAAVGAFLLLRK